jgi:hypothetical protein
MDEVSQQKFPIHEMIHDNEKMNLYLVRNKDCKHDSAPMQLLFSHLKVIPDSFLFL